MAVRRIAAAAGAVRRGGMPERGLMGLPDAAGAWRRDGCVVVPGCRDGPALEAARRDLAAVYPSAGECHTAPAGQ